MKRDMNLIRLLLLEEEGGNPNLTDYTEKEKVYNAALAIEAGLLHGKVIESDGQPEGVSIFRLTWEGHDFLDAARNESVWKKVSEKVKDKGMSLTYAVLKTTLEGMIRQQINT